jgi:curved DNA-binding protein CbpA
MHPASRDHYRTLQVDPKADAQVIKSAYRALARVFHPDVQGDDEVMKRLNQAWEVLGDPARRAKYDAERAGRHGATNVEQHAGAFASRSPADSAGPPQGAPFGSVIGVGRYDGWTIGQVAQVDRPFLEWLRSAPAGRGLRDEIDAILAMRATGGGTRGSGSFETVRARTAGWWNPAAATPR